MKTVAKRVGLTTWRPEGEQLQPFTPQFTQILCGSRRKYPSPRFKTYVDRVFLLGLSKQLGIIGIPPSDNSDPVHLTSCNLPLLDAGSDSPMFNRKTMGKPWENHGKMVIYMENHHFQWVNPLFLWPFSIANCLITIEISCFWVTSLFSWAFVCTLKTSRFT